MVNGFCLSVVRILFWISLLDFITGSDVKADDQLLPLIPKGKGEQCVENTDFMRRNHMDLLKHQRDETVHKGLRTTRHSLKECITCHVVLGQNGEPVTISNKEHFCNVCHSYAAVTPDCFTCHSSTPGLE